MKELSGTAIMALCSADSGEDYEPGDFIADSDWRLEEELVTKDYLEYLQAHRHLLDAPLPQTGAEIEALAGLLRSGSAEERRRAAVLLAHSGCCEAYLVLQRAREEADEPMRAFLDFACAEALIWLSLEKRSPQIATIQ